MAIETSEIVAAPEVAQTSTQSGGDNPLPKKAGTDSTWSLIHGIICMACKKQEAEEDQPPLETYIWVTDPVCVQPLVPRRP